MSLNIQHRFDTNIKTSCLPFDTNSDWLWQDWTNSAKNSVQREISKKAFLYLWKLLLEDKLEMDSSSRIFYNFLSSWCPSLSSISYISSNYVMISSQITIRFSSFKEMKTLQRIYRILVWLKTACGWLESMHAE